MKKSFLFILLPVLVMLCGTVRADDSVVIGTGTSSTGWLPFHDTGGSGNAHGATQSIYTADEIGRTGIISQIAYNVVLEDPQPTLGVQVYMGLTSMETFGQNGQGIPQNDLTLVYSGSPIIASTLGWETIALQTPFNYDGSQNLVIAIFRQMEYTLEGHLSRYACSSSSHLSLYRYSSNSSYSSASFISNYTLSQTDRSRADIRIDFEYDGVEFISEGVKYKATSDETVKVVGNSYSGIVRVPASVTHNEKTYAVKEIGAYAFQECTSLSYVLLNNGIETIGTNAFYGCTSLSSISIPSSVTSIANGAFQNCTNLKTVTVDGPVVEKTYTSSSNLTTIFGRQVTKYTIGANVTKVGDYAFYNASNVTSLSVGKNVTVIGNSSLYGCSRLTSVTLPSGLNSIGSNAMRYCSGLKDISIPGSVTSIGSDAFDGCSSLTKAEFASVESLCKIDFANEDSNPLRKANHLYVNGTEVVDVIVPNTVESIGAYAFYGALSIESVSLPNSITTIGRSAFALPEGIPSLAKAEFASVEALCKINFDDIWANPLFYATHLYVNGAEVLDVVVPNTVESIGAYSFYRALSIKSVSIPSSVTSIGSDAFECCPSLTKAEFASVESLCKIDFASQSSNPLYYAKHLYVNGTELFDVVVPNTISSINNKTFYNASSIESVSIPSSVTSIESNSFYGCSKLTTVAIDSPTLVEKTYSSSTNDNLPYVFGSQVKKFIIGDEPTKIGDYGFYRKTGITEVELGKNIISIGRYAFYGCTGLSTMELPEGLTSTGYESFRYCTGLTTLTLPSTLTSFGGYDFYGCNNLSNVYAHYITPPSLPSTPFNNYGNLHVYKQMANKYSSQNYWKNFTIVDDIDYQTVTGISFGQPNYAVEVGDLGELTCTVSPSNALLKDVIWSTEDNDKIFVDANTGQFVGLSDGVATVKATSVDYNGFSATVQVFVGNTNREEAITLNQSSLNLRINHTTTLIATQVTNTGSDKPVTWTSSNTSVATVSNGVVTGVGEGTAVITASIEGGASATCTVNVSVLRATLADGSVSTYSNNVTDDYDQIVYTRNFSNTKWQSLYVPFTMTYEDWKEDFDVAYINSVRQYDNDGDGAVDETIMDVIQILGGELYPNMPYLIRAKSTGEKTITLNEATLYKTEENSIECSTMLSTFTFTGTYSTIPAATLQANGYYAMGGGSLIMTNGTSSLKPFRWYLDITSRSPMYNTAVHNPSRIGIHVIGEENGMETRIYEVAREEELDAQIFNLNGQKMGSMENLAPGVYVKNGKKFIIK